MKKSTRSEKKLLLKTETTRTLEREQLIRAAGGEPIIIAGTSTPGCYSNGCG
jgi:hypothetical protein